MNDKEGIAGKGPSPASLPRSSQDDGNKNSPFSRNGVRRQAIDEAKMTEIAALALGHRYGIQTIARRTGVTTEAVAVSLRNKGIYWHPALKEWRSRTPNTKKGVL